MPGAVEEQTLPTESFSDFRGSRGAAKPAADTAVVVDDPADTGSKTAGDANPSTGDAEPKVADASETSQKQSKVDKRKGEIQREIDELVRKRETLKREVEAAKPSDKGAPEKTAKAPAAADGTDASDPKPKVPDPKDAKYGATGGWEAYEDDRLRYAVELAKWEIRSDNRAREAQTAREATEKAHQSALDKFEARGTEFASEGTDHADYPELVEQFKSRTISNEVAAVIVNAENGPEILYELMTNPDEMKRIESLPTAIDRLDAMYELKYKLKAPAKAEASEPATAQHKTKSAAPAIGTRLSGSGSGVSKEPSTFAGFRKAKFG